MSDYVTPAPSSPAAGVAVAVLREALDLMESQGTALAQMIASAAPAAGAAPAVTPASEAVPVADAALGTQIDVLA